MSHIKRLLDFSSAEPVKCGVCKQELKETQTLIINVKTGKVIHVNCEDEEVCVVCGFRIRSNEEAVNTYEWKNKEKGILDKNKLIGLSHEHCATNGELE